jgi:hypothetical protein
MLPAFFMLAAMMPGRLSGWRHGWVIALFSSRPGVAVQGRHPFDRLLKYGVALVELDHLVS